MPPHPRMLRSPRHSDTHLGPKQRWNDNSHDSAAMTRHADTRNDDGLNNCHRKGRRRLARIAEGWARFAEPYFVRLDFFVLYNVALCGVGRILQEPRPNTAFMAAASPCPTRRFRSSLKWRSSVSFTKLTNAKPERRHSSTKLLTSISSFTVRVKIVCAKMLMATSASNKSPGCLFVFLSVSFKAARSMSSVRSTSSIGTPASCSCQHRFDHTFDEQL